MIKGIEYDPEYDGLIGNGKYYLQNYDSFCKEFVKDQADRAGGINNLGKNIGVDPGNLSKIISGKYIPSPKTMIKWFPGLTIDVHTLVGVDYEYWYKQ